MALTKKPRVGETLVDGKGVRWVVLREINADILAIHNERRGESSFIWRFHDGLNLWFSHTETSE